MTIEERIQALDEKYKQHITGLNLQIAAMMSQYSALTMQYALLLTRVDILEHPELQSIPDVSESVTVPPTPHTAERSRAMNTPPPMPPQESEK